jgi:hypothetical protein
LSGGAFEFRSAAPQSDDPVPVSLGTPIRVHRMASVLAGLAIPLA